MAGKQVQKFNVERLLLERELGRRLLSKIFRNVITVSVSTDGGRRGRGLGSSGLSELSLDPSDGFFKLGRLQRNAQIVTVNIPGILSSRILDPDQRVRSALGALASKLPTPREFLTSPSPSFGDGFTRALGDVYVSHRELLAFLEVTEGNQGEFGCAGFVERGTNCGIARVFELMMGVRNEMSCLVMRGTYVAGDIVESGTDLSRGADRCTCPLYVLRAVGRHVL